MVEIQIHLPIELHQELIRLKLDPSQLLQDAIHQATGRDRRRAAAWLETILSTKNR